MGYAGHPMTDANQSFLHPSRVPPAGNRMLIVFDGGDAPGYSSVAVALTEEATRRGYEVWAIAR